MALNTVKGVGQESVGDPFGGGGPIHLVRALAIASHIVRVVFDDEPLHNSPAGKYDARNPSNYIFTVFSGQLMGPPTVGFTPTVQCVGVNKKLIFNPTLDVNGNLVVNPALGVLTNQVGVDIHTDKPVVSGVVYTVRPINIKSRGGGSLGFPYTANFPGVIGVQQTQPPRQPRGFTDFSNDIALGAWTIDSTGDLALEFGLASLRKRIYRRLITQPGAFAWLPNYGVGIKNKEIAAIATLNPFRQEILRQVRQEPEVSDAEVNLSLIPEGVLEVRIKVRVLSGLNLDITEQFMQAS
jgi:hypothetical protein